MRKRLVLAITLLLAMLAPAVHAAPARIVAFPWAPGPIQTADRMATQQVAERWIVRLAEPPLAQAPLARPDFAVFALGSPEVGRLELDSPAAQQYRSHLDQQQTRMFAQIQRMLPQAQLQRRYAIIFNGMSIALPGADAAAVDRLRAMPGVAAVYPDLRYQLNMFSSI